jgi:predicted AAA+ superfamily ATPase
VTEFLKAQLNRGLSPGIFFWRNSKGLEVDILIENGDTLWPVEIKSGQTIASDFFASLKKWSELASREDKPAWLVYGGNLEMQNGNVTIIPWRILPKLAVQLGI